MAKLIEIFKTGQHTAMNGVSLTFSEADLIASAAAYNPALHEAPIVVGHPQVDAPAYGWVKSLSYADGLQATPYQLDAAFTEMVGAGRFKKISASFYTPDSPNNPVPGVYYLRHVGFLGAQAPAVKGLKPVEFSQAEVGIVNFSEIDDLTNASLWRGLREFFISKFGTDEADKTIPGYAVAVLEQTAQAEQTEDAPVGDNASLSQADYQETLINPGETMSNEDKARLATLEAENRQLKASQVALDHAESARKATALHAENTNFAEGLIKAGTLLPTQKAVTVATLDFLGNQKTEVEFSEGELNKSLLVGIKQLLSALPKQIDFSELAGGVYEAAELLNYAAPAGFTVDTERLSAHTQAIAYQGKHQCDYMTALRAVGVN